MGKSFEGMKTENTSGGGGHPHLKIKIKTKDWKKKDNPVTGKKEIEKSRIERLKKNFELEKEVLKITEGNSEDISDKVSNLSELFGGQKDRKRKKSECREEQEKVGEYVKKREEFLEKKKRFENSGDQQLEKESNKNTNESVQRNCGGEEYRIKVGKNIENDDCASKIKKLRKSEVRKKEETPIQKGKENGKSKVWGKR